MQRLLVLVAQLSRLADPAQQLVLLGVRARAQIALELLHALRRDPVQIALRAGEDRHDHVLDGPRVSLGLLERLDQALAARKRLLRLGIELRPELRERLQLPVLRELEPQLSGHLLHRLRLRVAAHARDRDTDVDRGPHARVEQARLEEDLTVGDRDHVRGDVGGDVSRLRLDDRQRRQRAAAEVVVQAHRPLEQARVQVEDVTRVGLAAGRPPQQQRHLAVGVRVLGEVVVDAERVLAVVEEVLAHRAACVRAPCT